MAFASSTTLLSLTNHADQLILSYLADSEGGATSLLNLRLTCSHLKKWVDNLPRAVGKRFFSNVETRVDYNTKNIRRFLKHPPPKHVTSLALNVTNLFISVCSVDGADLWDRFMEFWESKLDCLDLEGIFFRVETGREFVIRILQSPSLKCFRSSIVYIKGHILFEDCRELKSLTRFETVVYTDVELPALGELIEARKNDSVFEMSLEFSENLVLSEDEWEAEHPWPIFTKSVGTSKSKIRLRKLDHRVLDFISLNLADEVARDFFKCVESIFCKNFTYFNCQPELFLNLKKVVFGSAYGSQSKNITWPASIRELTILKEIPEPKGLPCFLKCLNLSKLTCSFHDLLLGLSLLTKSCPGLASLSVCWFNLNKKSRSSIVSLPIEFPNLRSLDFSGYVRDSGDEVMCKFMLINLLQIHTLYLYRLSLRCRSLSFLPRPMLDQEALTSLCEGPIAKTILSVDIPNQFVTTEAQPLAKELKLLAIKNSREKLGFVAGNSHVGKLVMK